MNMLSSVTTFQHEQTRTISPENMTGEKGKSCMAASHLGPGRKGSGFIRIPAGESITIADIKGPAEIRHMWFTLTDKTHRGSFVLRDVVIRIYWDDETVPSVESPIGDFFCNGFGARCDINSLPIIVNPTGGFNSYFRMPFNRSAKIVISNEHEADIEHFFSQLTMRWYPLHLLTLSTSMHSGDVSVLPLLEKIMFCWIMCKVTDITWAHIWL